MRIIATVFQIVGLFGLPVAGALEFGTAGAIGGGSLSLIYLGLAMERD